VVFRSMDVLRQLHGSGRDLVPPGTPGSHPPALGQWCLPDDHGQYHPGPQRLRCRFGTAPNTVLTYRVLRDSVPGPSMQVTATDCSCHPSNYCGYGGIECGVVPNNCGGTESCGQCATGMACSSNHCCPQGQAWDNIRNICTAKPKQCPTGWGDCGGYCCKCTKETCS
jgi:hypothetical protein